MKWIAFVLCFTLGLNAQNKITLEDVWLKGTFRPSYAFGFNVMNDGIHYTDIEEKDAKKTLCKYDLKSGKKKGVLVNADDLKLKDRQLDIYNYMFSPNEDMLLLWEDGEQIYRRSAKANYFIYVIATKKIIELSTNGKQMFPLFAPDGTKIAFVRDNNIYIKDLIKNVENPVTYDGVNNKIKNGWADWVYEEEFSKADYMDWSSDSKYLAYVKFNESRVKDFTMEEYNGGLYPGKYTFKYPKAGEDNSIVSVHIYSEDSKRSITADIGINKDIYIPRIQFTNNPLVLCIQRLNRLQNKLELLFADAVGGKSMVAYTDESKTYVDITDDLTFVGNEGFIISSERDNYNHLYYYNLEGKLINQITKGEWDVIEFKGFNDEKNTLYFVSTENGPANRDVYSIKLDGSEKTRLSMKDGFNNFEFTPGYKYYISDYSNANTPNVYELKTIDGKLVQVLEDNKALNEKMKEYTLSPRTFFTFTTSENVSLNGWMMKPHNFDSTKKYPVYMYAYNGPGSNEVNNAWDPSEYFWHNYLNQEGYMVVCVDGRGTLGRGREFKHCTYLQLGKYETMDQIEAAKYLGSLPYVDASRIGFQGWSYGGYMAGLMITKGADYIKAAISVAPVTNWKYYDNIYTERFMRTPEENKAGYEDNSPINFVDKIKGKYLLIHGSSDDNVHVQNSMEMAAQLVKKNIPFDFMIYPNKNHGIAGGNTRLHIYSKIFKFVKENL
ncbi:MAG: S9 family peptidase [Sphingobacteriaceae bacterium]|nr:S9 family peptidase [Sphingobacteriaceae bacterium]